MAKRKTAVRARKAARSPKKHKSTRQPARRASSTRRAGKTASRRPGNKAAARSPRRSTSGTGRAGRARRTAETRGRNKGQARGTSAAAGTRRPKPAALARARRQLRDDETVPTPPSTLNFDRGSSAAASGREAFRQRRREHTEGGPALTGGDVDTDWGEAYASGEETPGGDMPTPDQDVVEEIGRALGVEYEDAEELKGSEKIEERDRHRWEYDPASAEDYKDRNRRD